ncbi:MAG: hypothetical protein AABY22_01365 [Nanoarchaeota archaeon]
MEIKKIKLDIVAWLVQRILLERKRKVGWNNNKVIDFSNSILYFVENNLTKQKILKGIKENKNFKDIFFIDSREIPSDIEEAWKYLSEKVV